MRASQQQGVTTFTDERGHLGYPMVECLILGSDVAEIERARVDDGFLARESGWRCRQDFPGNRQCGMLPELLSPTLFFAQDSSILGSMLLCCCVVLIGV